MAKSNFGLVVISPAFISKQWTEYELRGLNAREISGGKVILPIWDGIDREAVLNFSPPLADKFAIVADRISVVQVAVKIIETVRPDLFAALHRMHKYRQFIKNAKLENVKFDKIITGPIRHKSFPTAFVVRIRLLQTLLNDYLPSPVAEWLDNFSRDMNPMDELFWWERFAFVFFESARQLRMQSTDELNHHFGVVFAVANKGFAQAISQNSTFVEESQFEAIASAFNQSEQEYQAPA